MKKTSILSLLGLAGFFAFSAPIFAQETEEVADVEDAAIVADVEDAVAEDVAPVEEDVAAIEEDADTSFEDAIKNNPEAVAELNDAMDQFIGELDLSEEERAELEANFESPEERAVFVAAIGTLLAGAGVIYLVIAVIWCIILIIALWKAFTKAGEAGWKAIIPIWNIYIVYKIAGFKNWFWYTIIIAVIGGLIAYFVPDYADIVNGIVYLIDAIIGIIVSFQFARKYGWGVFTSILFVLFTGICLLFLGFGSCKYQGEEA